MTKNYFILFAVSMCILSCSNEAPPKPSPVDVIVITVEEKTIPINPEFVGVTQSSHQVEIRARVEGYLEEISFVEGDVVKVDELLFKLDARPFEASLLSAKAELARQKAILWDAERSVERLKPLFEQKAASRKDYDNATSQMLAGQAAVEVAKAAITQAELNLAYTTIKSPVAGLSSRANFRVGALITPGNNSLLTTISLLNPIWVNFSVSEGELVKTEKEEKNGTLIVPKDKAFSVELILSDGSLYPEKGAVDFAEPSYDAATGTLMVRASIPNPNLALRPGQFVRIRLLGINRPNAILIPQQAVQQGRGGEFVYVVNKDSQAEKREVIAGNWYKGDQWIISKGLAAGDIVIVDGTNKVQNNTPVNIVKK